MSTQPVSPLMNLEYFRKQAKSLLQDLSAGNPDTSVRIEKAIGTFDKPRDFKLSDAQWVIARESGHESWTSLKRACEVQIKSPINLDPPSPSPIAAPAADPPPMSDEAVKSKTGMNWEEWASILDSEGCAQMTHQQIVGIVGGKFGMGAWYQQMVTVGYERMRGLRVKNQTCAGGFSVSASKTLPASALAVFERWNNLELRQDWLPGAELTIRKATPGKSLRITWADGSNVDVNLTPKGQDKSICAVEHAKLASQDLIDVQRSYWTEALNRLKELME